MKSGELPLAMQTKAFDFLDDRKYKRIGGLEDIELDVRDCRDQPESGEGDCAGPVP